MQTLLMDAFRLGGEIAINPSFAKCDCINLNKCQMEGLRGDDKRLSRDAIKLRDIHKTSAVLALIYLLYACIKSIAFRIEKSAAEAHQTRSEYYGDVGSSYLLLSVKGFKVATCID
ncbi:uncharacterized protein ACN2A1_014359 [Glossina fuscipes fuscipes]